MPLPTGTPAPDFTLRSMTDGGIVDIGLRESLGSKATVLVFFPAAFSGVCTEELCGIASGQFLKPSEGVSVLGISVDAPHAQAAWAKKENITVPLLSDYARKVIQEYDVVNENFAGTGGASAARAVYVLDNSGVVVYADRTEKAGDLPDFGAVQKALDAMG